MEKCISEFIDAIKDYMFQKNISRSEFAKNINSYERCISRWFDGTNTPSLEYVIRIADYLNCSIDYLFGFTPFSTFTPCSQPTTFSARLGQLLTIKKISRNKLAAVCKVTSSNVSKWILTEQLPKPDIICLLASYFNCSIDFLLGRTDIS